MNLYEIPAADAIQTLFRSACVTRLLQPVQLMKDDENTRAYIVGIDRRWWISKPTWMMILSAVGSAAGIRW